jgi:glycosyltransferase involved in cell wall biosynthesis
MPAPSLRTVQVDSVRGWGGGQVQLLMLARGLAERGHAVTLVCQPRSALAQLGADAGLPVIPVRMRHDGDVFAVLALVRLLRRLAPEVVHLHSGPAHTLGSLAARGARVPVVVASRRTAFPLGRSWVNRRRYGRWVDRIVAVSTGARDAVLEAGVAPPEQVTVIHSAVDCARFRPMDRTRARFELGLPPRAAVLGCVGRIESDKGQHVLVEAAARIAAARSDALFVICGEGEQSEAMRAQVGRERLAERVRFLGRRDDVRPVLAALDVFVLPSLQEGLGVALLEAMAMARPAVASRVGGIPDAVDDGVTGLLVPPGEAQALAEAVLSLLSDDPLRARMGAAARARAAAFFSPQAMVAETEALYLRLLEAKRGRGACTAPDQA